MLRRTISRRRIVAWPQALVISMLCAGSVAVGQDARLLPVDEASNDPSFFAFRMTLMEAAANRDTSFVIRHLAPDVKSNFGGDVGAADFSRFWRIGDLDSPLWGILAKVLGGGGVLWEDGVGGNGFEAPYWTAVWDVDKYNPFDYGVILSENEPVYARPDLESVVGDSASFEIVRIANPYVLSAAGDDRQWSEVELGSGNVGYVPSSVIGSAVDHRMMFRKVGGRWTILWLLAGD
ncbi:MAG: hypothetical protein HKN37_02555 [Rhodothermales bacterium]|nr:hypothetical protein [Rhodothermales bacterium]